MDDTFLLLLYLLPWLTLLTVGAFVADVVIPAVAERRRERQALRRVMATRRLP